MLEFDFDFKLNSNSNNLEFGKLDPSPTHPQFRIRQDVAGQRFENKKSAQLDPADLAVDRLRSPLVPRSVESDFELLGHGQEQTPHSLCI